MSREDFELLKAFLEEKDVAIRAAKPLRDGSVIRMKIVDDPGAYYAIRESKATRLKEGEPPSEPQVEFTLPPKAIRRLHDFGSSDIGEYGIEFFKLMLHKDPEMKMTARLNTGFFGLTRMGVFGILALGGGSVVSFLAREGVRDFRKAISSLRGKED